MWAVGMDIPETLVLSIHPTRSFKAPASFLPALPRLLMASRYSFHPSKTSSMAFTVLNASSRDTSAGGGRFGGGK
jgi:hypothetical protein